MKQRLTFRCNGDISQRKHESCQKYDKFVLWNQMVSHEEGTLKYSKLSSMVGKSC